MRPTISCLASAPPMITLLIAACQARTLLATLLMTSTLSGTQASMLLATKLSLSTTDVSITPSSLLTPNATTFSSTTISSSMVTQTFIGGFPLTAAAVNNSSTTVAQSQTDGLKVMTAYLEASCSCSEIRAANPPIQPAVAQLEIQDHQALAEPIIIL
jgi:hypothetical protein